MMSLRQAIKTVWIVLNIGLLCSVANASQALDDATSSASTEVVPTDPCKGLPPVDVEQLSNVDAQAYKSAVNQHQFYQFFQLAEQVSREHKYPTNKTNKLVLQLICHEEFAAPAELQAAGLDAYTHWKARKPFVFNLCDYITSGTGGAFCADRDAVEQERSRGHRLQQLIGSMSKLQQQSVMSAYQFAAHYFDMKAADEELHGGTGHVAWRIESANRQKDDYLTLIQQTIQGDLPKHIPSLERADDDLNSVYQDVKSRLTKQDITGFNMRVTFSGVRNVQRTWLKYRDKTAAMLAGLNSQISQKEWQALLTQKRVGELKRLVDFDEDGP